MLRPSIEWEFRFVTGQPTFYVKPRKSHMETNISNRSETESRDQAHTQREASGSGKAIVLQENQSWTQTVSSFFFSFQSLCWWHCDTKSIWVWFSVQVQTGLLFHAGETTHHCCSQFCRTQTRKRSQLRHKQTSALRCSSQNKEKTIKVRVLLSFHCLCVTWTDRKLPVKVC